MLRSHVDTDRTQSKFDTTQIAKMEKDFTEKEAELRRDRAYATKKADRRESDLNTWESALAARESALEVLIAKHTEANKMRQTEAERKVVEIVAASKDFAAVQKAVDDEKEF